jgi:hypothetical protein
MQFVGEGSRHFVTFHEELDTEYWSSMRDSFFNPTFEEAAPPIHGAVGVVFAALLPALEQSRVLLPGGPGQRPTASRVAGDLASHITPQAGESSQPGSRGGAHFSGPHARTSFRA